LARLAGLWGACARPGLVAGATDDFIQLAFSDTALTKIFTNRAKDFIEWQVGKQIALDKQANIFRRGLSREFGLFLNGLQLSRPKSDALQRQSAHVQRLYQEQRIMDNCICEQPI
jgi:hypothetical protein